ncbi:hypothetical protein BMS3Bbin14_00403 [bacterium BMS3Bbin14]|nr:hypothetical protein BMS3Abin13_00457 [bacterium BMS3Abin13]GBE51945.1 hypothetical protein BMS3Bbin14_00403 [bacterium BMS3Bbin14]HDO29483.1 DUF2062 domain-containing protein [Desulfobacteraceae bacterium]
MALNLKRTLRYFSLRFKRLRGDPRSLAMGTAIGIFVGITPTMPLHTVTIIGLTLLLRASTIAALIAATAISNPLTFVPQYYLAWKVGNALLPGRLSWERLQGLMQVISNNGFIDGLKAISNLSGDALLVMLTGGFLLALPLAIASYFLSLRFFYKIREKRLKRHILH